MCKELSSSYYYYYYHYLSFETLRSVHLSLRGSRMPFCIANEVLDNFRFSVKAAEVYFLICSRNYLFCFRAF